MAFRDLQLKINYTGRGERTRDEFVVPLLRESVEYDRVTSFFTIGSLVAIAEGLERLWGRGGRMRLVLGLHDVSADLIEAARRSEDPAAELVALVRRRIIEGIASIRDELVVDRLSTIAWMMKDGLLTVRVAAPEAVGSGPPGIFHNKLLIFRDEHGDAVAGVGSPNETEPGLGRNHEHLTAFTSWDQPAYTEAQTGFFERLWNDDEEGLTVRQLQEHFADELLAALPRKPEPAVRPSGTRHKVRELLGIASRMPALAMLSGGHTALYPHQESVFMDILSRWPVRAMLADEVGLGKTFEAGAAVRYLVEHLGAERVLILAPKAVIYQWQAELSEHFGLDAWVYDSARRCFISSKDRVLVLGDSEAIISGSTPPIAIVSAQLARGTRAGGHIFDNATELPDVLVVDEAHAARVKPDISGREHPTLMWRMLDDIVRRVPHVLFATATPMQVHWREYHALLALLGLPEEWADPQNYKQSLELIVSTDPPQLNDAALVARLIRTSLLGFRPKGMELGPEENRIAEGLTGPELDQISSAVLVRSGWPHARSLFAKSHPARFLTIRNTRSALERIGYSFPERVLPASHLVVPEEVQLFYRKVEAYLDQAYFEVERILYPDKKFSVGFVKCAYQQRLASSLAACRLSLRRRRDRVSAIERGSTELTGLDRSIDELLESEVFEDETLFDLSRPVADGTRAARAAHAASLERTFIDDLTGILDRVLEIHPDPKMTVTAELIARHVSAGDQVLVFSRYTDTLDAVVELHRAAREGAYPPYAVYTGRNVLIDLGVGTVRSTRQEVRGALDDGSVSVVFCSDAASEGLNLQAARVIINVDVPWNPARLEQRIGRIARLGQRAPTVDIYNLWYPDSIEANMYTRLMERRDLFELAVGEFPDVVGRAIREQLSSRFGTRFDNSDPIAELNRLKNNVQVQALRKLWDREVPTRTLTGRFREQIAALAVAAAENAGLSVERSDADDRVRMIEDGTVTSFTLLPGGEDVLTLRHSALRWLGENYVPDPSRIHVLHDGSGPSVFQLDGSVVDPAEVPAFIYAVERSVMPPGNVTGLLNRIGSDTPGLLACPWLPFPSKLSMPVQLECHLVPSPIVDLNSLTDAPLDGYLRLCSRAN